MILTPPFLWLGPARRRRRRFHRESDFQIVAVYNQTNSSLMGLTSHPVQELAEWLGLVFQGLFAGVTLDNDGLIE
jgi:hypothetical protein